jgi:hypothetical protein
MHTRRPARRSGGSDRVRGRDLRRRSVDGEWGLDARNYRSAFAAVRWQPHQLGSNVGAIDEGFSGATDILVAVVGKQVNGARAVKDTVFGVQPLAYAAWR